MQPDLDTQFINAIDIKKKFNVKSKTQYNETNNIINEPFDKDNLVHDGSVSNS